MIKVIYDRERSLVTIDGHAGWDKDGRDIVCAAVSAITYTIANAIDNMKDAGHISARQMKLNKGDAVIRWVPKKAYSAVITLVVDAICAGYDLVAQQYPSHVTYEMKK